MILNHHEQVSGNQFFLASQHHIADAEIINLGALIRPHHHHRLVFAHLTIARLQRLHQLVARQHAYVGKTRKLNARQLCDTVVGNHTTYERSIV